MFIFGCPAYLRNKPPEVSINLNIYRVIYVVLICKYIGIGFNYKIL